MKLQDLSRRRIIHRAAQTNLVVNERSAVYIISDIPQLTRREYDKLKDVSFEKFQRFHIFPFPDSLKDQHDWGPERWKAWEAAYGENLIVTIKWKDLVAQIREEVPTDPELGDFDE